MLAPKCSTFNGRPTFANPMYLKKAQSEKPCLFEIPHDTSDPANRFIPDREETLTLEKERVIRRTNVSRPLLRSTQMKDKVVPNNSQVKFKKTEVEYHHRISNLEVALWKSTCFVKDLQGNDLLTDTTAPSQQEFDLLFGPLYDEFFIAHTSSVNKSSSPTDNSEQQDTPLITNIQSSTELTTPTSKVTAE
ncbi:hypothetical protein Tco_0722115 [Tanacetum coccineum]